MTSRNELAEAGVNVTHKKFIRMEEEARERARREAAILRNLGRKPNPAIQNIKRLIALVQAGVTLLVLFLIQGLGTIIALGASIYLEVQATSQGFAWIDSKNAVGYAIVSILLFVLLLFIHASLQRERGQQYRFSFRSWGQDLLYLLGVGEDWKRQVASNGIAGVIRLWVVAIVLFGFLGRIQTIVTDLALTTFTWREGVSKLLEAATLPQVVGIIGNTFYTIALTIGLHFVVSYIYSIYESLTGGGVTAANFFSEEAEVDEEALIQEELQKLYQAILAKNSTT